MEQRLNESGQYLRHFIETHILEIPDYSIVKLSERANVPTATIVGTVRKKGYEDFTSFKHHLKDKEDQNINFSTLEKVDRGIRTAILRNGGEVTHMVNMTEIGDIEDAIQKIKASRRIIIFAKGFSELITQETMIKFQLASKYCELHTDPKIIKDISKKLSKKGMALLVPLSGETQESVVAGKNCYDSEIGTILLTASRHSSLMRYIEIPFVGLKLESSFFPDYGVRSRLPLSILARTLLDAHALKTTT